MPSRLTLALKLVFDVILASIALICFAPLMAGLALAISLGSKGPVFFRQQRTGLHGKPFFILKFRTMVPNDGRGAKVTVGGDSRVTPIGAFLRKTKLDELPQLINVLRGEMSLIGPRPEVPEYTNKYSEEDRRVVLAVRPGLSDLASIRFRNESEVLAAQSDPLHYYETKLLPNKLRHGRFYVRRAGLLLDIKLILWTLMAIAGWVPPQFRRGLGVTDNKRGVALAALALLVGSAVYYALFLRHGLEVDDEGYLLLGASEVLRGLWPWADFHSYGPLSYWTLAALFKLFGNAVIVERWMLWGLLLLNGQAVLWIARKILPLRFAMAIAALYAIAPGPWYKLFFISTLLLVLVALLRWMQKPDAKRSLFLGLALGVATLCRLETGLIGVGLAGVAFILRMMVVQREKVTTLLGTGSLLAIGTLGLPALALCAYSLAGKTQAALQTLIGIYGQANTSTIMARMGILDPFTPSRLLSWPVPLEQAFYAIGLLSCLTCLCAFARAFVLKRIPRLSAATGFMIGLGALASLSYTFPFVWGTRMLSSFALVYICFAFLVLRVAARLRKQSHRKACIAAGFLALILCIGSFSKHQIYSGSITTRAAPTVAVAHPKLQGLYPYDENRADIEGLRDQMAQAPAGATLISMSESTTMGYLSGLPNPTTYRAFTVEFAKDGEQERAIATFDKLKITYFVARKRQFMAEGGPASDLGSYAPLIKAYLTEKYRIIPLGRHFVLLQRKDS